ncbi:hypothetical protein GOP47_0020834 [Adiantum capillus-veneris]|uniref:Uncharacterized protein n=1 Tax=Adiantum capillus-veneris TaxID=13818 RepID=A0A9D4Z7C3_ADICA|nr:hypothetical protein GOP47_0020834 [Adiantum capillus-veneris]
MIRIWPTRPNGYDDYSFYDIPFGRFRPFNCTDPSRRTAHKFVSVRLKRPFGVRLAISTRPKWTAMLSFVMGFHSVVLFGRLPFGVRQTPPVAAPVLLSNRAFGIASSQCSKGQSPQAL